MPQGLQIPSQIELQNLLYENKLRTGTDLINANFEVLKRLTSNTRSVAQALFAVMVNSGILRVNSFNDFSDLVYPIFFFSAKNNFLDCLLDITNGNFILLDGQSRTPATNDVIILYPLLEPNKIALYRYIGGGVNDINNWLRIEAGGSGGGRNIRTISQDSFLQENDFLVKIDIPILTPSVRLSLMKPSSVPGKEFVVSRIDDTQNECRISVPNGQDYTINYGFFYELKLKGETISFISDGDSNFIIKYN